MPGDTDVPDWTKHGIDARPATTLGNLQIVHGRQEMFIPSGGSIVRQAVIKIPRATFLGRPTTVITIYGETNNADPYCVYGVEWWLTHPVSMWCKVSAQVAGNPREDTYFCDYVLMETR